MVNITKTAVKYRANLLTFLYIWGETRVNKLFTIAMEEKDKEINATQAPSIPQEAVPAGLPPEAGTPLAGSETPLEAVPGGALPGEEPAAVDASNPVTTPEATATQGDPAEIIQMLEARIAELESEKSRYESVNNTLYDLVESEPALMGTLRSMIHDGKSFRAALAEHFDPEELKAGEDDEDYQDVEAARSARSERLTKKRQSEEEAMQNSQMSVQAVVEFAEENGISEEEAAGVLKAIDEEISSVLSGKLTKKFLNSMYKALNYEKDLEGAKEAGEIAGRNAKIEATRETGKQKVELPDLTGGSDLPPVAAVPKTRIDEILEYQQSKRIL